MSIKINKLKKFHIIAALSMSLYSINTSAGSLYGGLSFQENNLNTTHREYDERSYDVSGLVGYEFNKFKDLEYSISIETSYLGDKNKFSSKYAQGYIDQISFDLWSVNLLHHYNFDENSIFLITGINKSFFEFDQYNIYGVKEVSKSDSYGANIGVGLSWRLFENMKVRLKTTYHVLGQIKSPENETEGLTSSSVDIIIGF